MPSTDFLTYGYAAIVATGGLIGYIKAGIIFVLYCLPHQYVFMLYSRQNCYML